MLYSLLKFLMRFALRVYFRRVYFSRSELVPVNQALILACNHPNSFLDAIVLAVLLKRPLHFLARSDVFDAAWKRWILKKLHLIPIYRIQEGSENLFKNEETFHHCEEILKAKGAILIFSEGICVQEKRLRNLKKGTAKLAFQAEKTTDFKSDIRVICVGINYTYPSRFREELMIRFASPFKVSLLKDIYATSPAKAVREFNQLVKEGLKENVVIIEEESSEELAEKLLVIFRNKQKNKFFLWKSTDSQRLAMEKSLCNWINLLKNTSTENFRQLTEETNDYFELLKNYQLDDKDLNPQKSNFWLSCLLIFFASPFYIIAYLGNFIPLKIAKCLSDKKVKKIEFYASVNLALGFLLSLIYYLLLLLITSIYIKSFLFLVGIPLLPFLGYIALFYSEFVVSFWGKIRFRFLLCKHKGLDAELNQKRENILRKIRQFKIN